MLWPCSAAAAIVLSSILLVLVCCGPSRADESSSYIEVGPFLNFRRMGRGASLTAGVLTQRMSRCPGWNLGHLRAPRPSKRLGARSSRPPKRQNYRSVRLGSSPCLENVSAFRQPFDLVLNPFTAFVGFTTRTLMSKLEGIAVSEFHSEQWKAVGGASKCQSN
jgi:hypothetical protein